MHGSKQENGQAQEAHCPDSGGRKYHAFLEHAEDTRSADDDQGEAEIADRCQDMQEQFLSPGIRDVLPDMRLKALPGRIQDGG
mgnify:CR=1 FL=1